MRMEKHIQRFLRDDQGQTTTEYILMLSVVVMIAMKFRNIFGGKMEELIGKVTRNVEQGIGDQ